MMNANAGSMPGMPECLECKCWNAWNARMLMECLEMPITPVFS